MYDLTQRQIEILKRIVKEYIDSAEPIGSETLEKKYDLGVSPATIRNEMAQMIKLGYLSKPHSSAGRIPTSKAMKFYVSELMKEKELSLAETVEEKERVWDLREHQANFLREITRALAQKTKALAVTTTDTGDVFYSGYSNILEMPEFYDIDVTKNLLSLLDNATYFDMMIARIEKQFAILLGEEFEEELFRPYSFVMCRFNTRSGRSGTVGIIGPVRMQYDRVNPWVKYVSSLVEDVADW